jgi:N-acetylglutamate synthase-like GNAT family acetyltransferase
LTADIHIRHADHTDIDALVALVESAYRGDSSRQGWTSEADLIGGQRTSPHEMTTLLDGGEILVAETGREIVGCCHLSRIDEQTVHFGTFAVNPLAQGGGLGRRLFAAAEEEAALHFQATEIVIEVVAQQVALKEWYDRLGFSLTGRSLPFPAAADGAGPTLLRDDIHFLEMKKTITR